MKKIKTQSLYAYLKKRRIFVAESLFWLCSPKDAFVDVQHLLKFAKNPTIEALYSGKEMGLASPDKEKCVPGKNAPGATGSSSHTHTTVSRAI